MLEELNQHSEQGKSVKSKQKENEVHHEFNCYEFVDDSIQQSLEKHLIKMLNRIDVKFETIEKKIASAKDVKINRGLVFGAYFIIAIHIIFIISSFI